MLSKLATTSEFAHSHQRCGALVSPLTLSPTPQILLLYVFMTGMPIYVYAAMRMRMRMLPPLTNPAYFL